MKNSIWNRILALVVVAFFLMEQPGVCLTAGKAPGLVSAPPGEADLFRPAHLRFLGYNGGRSFGMRLDKGDAGIIGAGAERVAGELMRYFFIGCALPNDAIWVNLRPDGDDRMIDPDLERTDIGRILLEADVQLKKDVAGYTSPETSEGKRYWEQVYDKAEQLFGSVPESLPVVCRPWIVPGDIVAREDPVSAYIYKATLKVMLESDYVKGAGASFDGDERLRALNDYSAELLRQTVIPRLTKEVNSAKRYASLRQVYYSLILAHWFKRVANKGSDAVAIDNRDLRALASLEPWNKERYRRAYQESFEQGEYKKTERLTGGQGTVIRMYSSGGIVLDCAGAVQSGLVKGVDPAEDILPVNEHEIPLDYEREKATLIASVLSAEEKETPLDDVKRALTGYAGGKTFTLSLKAGDLKEQRKRFKNGGDIYAFLERLPVEFKPVYVQRYKGEPLLFSLSELLNNAHDAIVAFSDPRLSLTPPQGFKPEIRFSITPVTAGGIDGVQFTVRDNGVGIRFPPNRIGEELYLGGLGDAEKIIGLGNARQGEKQGIIPGVWVDETGMAYAEAMKFYRRTTGENGSVTVFSVPLTALAVKEGSRSGQDGGHVDLSTEAIAVSGAVNYFDRDLELLLSRIIDNREVQERVERVKRGRDEGFRVPLTQYKAFLRECGRRIRAGAGRGAAKVVYNPMNSCDILAPFVMTGASDVLAVSNIPFGDIADDLRRLGRAPAGHIGRYSYFDAMENLDYIRSSQKLSGLGTLAIIRAALYMEAGIRGVYYFNIQEDGSIRAAGPKVYPESFNNAVVIFQDPVTGEVKRFWYVQHDFDFHEDSFSNFINSLSFDTLLIKASFDLFEYNDAGVGYLNRANAIRDILAPAKRQPVPALVITDRRFHGRERSPDQYYAMWQIEPLSILLEGNQYLGYSGPGDRVFYGAADSLIDLWTPEEDIAGLNRELSERGYFNGTYFDGGDSVVNGGGGKEDMFSLFQATRPLAVLKERLGAERFDPDVLKRMCALIRDEYLTDVSNGKKKPGGVEREADMVRLRNLRAMSRRIKVNINNVRVALKFFARPSKAHRAFIWQIYSHDYATSPLTRQMIRDALKDYLTEIGATTSIDYELHFEPLEYAGLVNTAGNKPVSIVSINKENMRAVYPDIDTFGAAVNDRTGNNPGGIDFRSLPVTIADRMKSMCFQPEAQRMDLAREWGRIDKLCAADILSSPARLEEFAAACGAQRSVGTYRRRLSRIVSRILRREETEASPTEPALHTVLWMIEYGLP